MLLAVDMDQVAPRSSLEEMLDSLKKRDDDKLRDVLPALPSRPSLKGRLPPARKSLPLNFKIGSTKEGMLKDSDRQDGKEAGVVNGEKYLASMGGIFGRKRAVKVDQLVESPYIDSLEDAAAASYDSSTRDEKLGSGENMNYVLKKKLRVWCQLPDAKWELGIVQSISEEDANVLLSDDQVLTVFIDNLLPANPDILDGADDLIQLSYLNTPSVLHNLKCRYTHDLVYTKAGPVLVAVNPFKEVPLYETDRISAYRQKVMDSPHVYAVADTAFSEMMRDGMNQSIIISGESGAGKTETAKIAMQYLASLGASGGIEHEVLQSNIILESFGNAKTSKNNNSSRFGRLTEICFNTTGKICGAKIETFLLEKLRVVQRANGERSYHVFYQLCAGAPPLLKERLNLRAASEYEYLKQSGPSVIDGVDDAQRFHMLMEAFDIVQISREDQETAFMMLATVLWLGNIAFSTIDDENHVEVVSSEGVTNSAKLLGCEVSDLMLALSTSKFQVDNDTVVQKLTLSQAIDTRDALAKSIYACLFDWLVERINKSLEIRKSCSGKSISILDIYGFESLQKNSFEQFCINYANERLQQHFNRHLFKLEQEDYIQDGIYWTNVDFADNIECLNLFEKKPHGLLSLLDEESAFPKATNLTLLKKFKHHLNENPCFKGERGGAIKISHYAGEVLYHTNGFLAKNRDLLHSESAQLLLSCSCRLPKSFASHMFSPSQEPISPHHSMHADLRKQSVVTTFKGQLFKLIQRLESTAPHFIRCIKPNSKLIPGIYEDELVSQQLRSCGLLEIVRISKSGYPTRMTHQQFSERYGFLLFENVELEDPLSISVAILHQFNIPPEMYQVGYTKFFFRTGEIAALEEVRNHTVQGTLRVQKCVRGLQGCHDYQELKKVIRSEVASNEFQKHAGQYLGERTLDNLQKDSEMSDLNCEKVNREQDKNLQKMKDSRFKEYSDKQDSDMSELQSRVQKAEAILSRKEVENATLQEQIQQYEKRRSEYEDKMRSKEEMWQKEVTALQKSLAAAKKNLADTSPMMRDYDSESAISTASHTPQSTPPKQHRASDAGVGRDFDGNRNTAGHLVKEFEQRTQAFEDDARSLVESKPGQSGSNLNNLEELRKLKVRYAAWKKDYRSRLREAKAAALKLGFSEGEKRRIKWWRKRCSKS